jgi:hypothetical protein
MYKSASDVLQDGMLTTRGWLKTRPRKDINPMLDHIFPAIDDHQYSHHWVWRNNHKALLVGLEFKFRSLGRVRALQFLEHIHNHPDCPPELQWWKKSPGYWKNIGTNNEA